MSKRILVTGGAGFLGTHLCERLLHQGNDVICMDNFYTGRKKNIKHMIQNDHFELISHDVTMPFSFEVDEIYNMACPASPVDYQLRPIETLKTSVYGAINVLELARKTKAKVFHASTSEVYGDPMVHPPPEEYFGHVNPNGIRACYDEGKRCAETLMFDYSREYGIDARIGRIFNTYGPMMQKDDGRVISNFIVQALTNQDITVYGDGTQTRSFCYVTDLINGILDYMDKANTIGPINLGNTWEFTIEELANIIIEYTGSKSKIVYKDLPSDDPMQRKPDISKAKELFGFNPNTTLKLGLYKTIEYFMDEIKRG